MSVLIVYVDEITVIGNHTEEISLIKEMLAKEFGVRILVHSGMLGSKPNKTPIELGDKRKMFGGNPVDKGRYQQLVGAVIYLSHTRLDIAIAVSLVSQYMHDPCQGHLNAIYRVLRYHKQTIGTCLFFRKITERKVEMLTDADWAGSVDDRKSISGYCTLLWGSVEAKYRAMAHGVCEGIWIKRLLEELKIEYEAPI
ncbi:secreted RxLR effector protein 161-like [Humulus lupulus]|uniref:secreted RxLR effector protein 161-like n=1 Tax=Humulus lupulus TaxID=3486 RepID=UPI002B403C78|nr:secreted RxLR effector protein 161-like [Humulus lupulus]